MTNSSKGGTVRSLISDLFIGFDAVASALYYLDDVISLW